MLQGNLVPWACRRIEFLLWYDALMTVKKITSGDAKIDPVNIGACTEIPCRGDKGVIGRQRG